MTKPIPSPGLTALASEVALSPDSVGNPLSLRRLLTAPFLLLCAALLAGRVATADDKGKEIAKGLLKALIESQMERQGRESFRPGQPVPPVHVDIPRPVQATAEMVQIRRLLASLNQETATLTAQLNADSRRSPNARNLLPDALQFQAASTATLQRAERENNHLVLQLPLQTLDQSWKPLAHKIASTQGTSAATRECTDRISRLDAQACQILGIREQFNGRELVRAADLLAADLKTLTDEVSYSGSANAKTQRLIPRMRRLQEQATLFANLSASGAQFPTVVAEYRILFQSWQAVRPELDQFPVRSITRSVSRIQETHQTIHQLLRLDFGIDLALVQKMAEALERDITDLYRTVTLEQVMTLPDSRSLPSSADALFGMAQNLSDVVARKEPLQAVGEAWLYLDEQWHLFEFYLSPIHTPDTCRRIEGLSQSIASLKNAIGVSVVFDRNQVLQQTASLESLTEHLHETVHRWLTRPGQKAAGLIEKTHQLEERCVELAALANSSRDRAAIAAKCDEIIVVWQTVRPELNNCQTEERESIEQIVDDFVPAMIHLRTMMEE